MTGSLAGTIIPLPVARLHHVAHGWTMREHVLADGVRLFVSDAAAIVAPPSCRRSHHMLRHALSIADTRVARNAWRLARSGWGQVLLEHSGDAPVPHVSISSTDAIVAVAIAPGAIGIDVETIARVSCNASRRDKWLSPAECAYLATSGHRQLAVELTCRWTLKEALAKLEGVGLSLPLRAMTLSARHGRAYLDVEEPASRRLTEHRLSLFDAGTSIVAVATQHVPTRSSPPKTER